MGASEVRRRVYLLPVLLYATALLLYLDWSEIVGNPPVADTDYATHWAETWTASHFLDDGHVWGYDPYFMAGYPGGLLYHNSARLVALLSWLASQTGVSLALAYNLVLASLLVVAPLLVFPAARWLGLRESDALVAQISALGLWLADPLIGWSWRGGAFTFLVAVLVSLLVLAAAVRITMPATGSARMPLAVWYVVGPLAFWLHSFSFLLLLAPLLVLTAARWRRLRIRQRLHLIAWPPLVLLVSLPWIIPSLQIAGNRDRSDFFLLGGIDALAADLLSIGFIDGASRPGLLGLRWIVLAIGGFGLWRLVRSRPELWSVAAGAWLGLALAYGGAYLPGGGNLQPYRYIQQAALWSTIGVMPAIRAGAARWRAGSTWRTGTLACGTLLAAAWIAGGVWPSRPPLLGGPDRVWRGPSAESQAICDTLRRDIPPGSRIVVDDWRLAAILPTCSGVAVLGGHFLWFPMDYGYATATIWEFLETPYPNYDPVAFRSGLETYNARWLLTRRWNQQGWYTLSNWLDDHPGQAESVQSWEHFDLWRVGIDPPATAVSADHQAIRIQEVPAGNRIVLPYHWLDSLRSAPDSVTLEPVLIGADPVPFIGVRSKQTGPVAICLHGSCNVE